MIDFVLKHPHLAEPWWRDSNYLCQLAAKDEEELWKLAEKAEKRGITCVKFFEPDIGNQLTAIALEPSIESRRITSRLPLMGKEYNQKPLEMVA